MNSVTLVIAYPWVGKSMLVYVYMYVYCHNMHLVWEVVLLKPEYCGKCYLIKSPSTV